MRMLGWIMLLVGLAVGLWGFMTALEPIAQMYKQATIDPLSDKMPDDGNAVASKMIVPAVIGVVGGAVGSAGSLILFVDRRKRKMLKRMQSQR